MNRRHAINQHRQSCLWAETNIFQYWKNFKAHVISVLKYIIRVQLCIKFTVIKIIKSKKNNARSTYTIIMCS